MCGIIGYTGTKKAEPILIEGLRALEYRGYDSAGIFIPSYGTVKSVGHVDNLAAKISESISGTSGIAHTRWATHGAPTEINAHPHVDMSGDIWIVHNGIIENYRELREELLSQGVSCLTETDTEVLAKLIGIYYTDNLLHAIKKALRRVRGTYGIVAIHNNDPHTLGVARMGSPIVIGIGKHGNFVASDVSALLEHTKEVVYLDDGDIALVDRKGYRVTSSEGKEKMLKHETIEWNIEAIQKNGYDHFLHKEIMEIPEVIENMIRGRLILESGRAKLGGLEQVLPQLSTLRRLMIVGCGSAAFAGQIGKYILEEYAGIPVDVELGSEYRYRTIHPQKNSALLAITQSGETADTLASVRKAKEEGLLTLGLVNVIGSSIARETDAGIYSHAGPEISIASTKGFVSQVAGCILLALLIGRERNMKTEEGIEIAAALSALPDVVRSVLLTRDSIKEVALKYVHAQNMMYIGRKFHAPVASEGALKLKEVTYIHAEAYPGGELKHGSIAMLDEHFPVMALVPQDDVYEKMISNVEEVRARKAPIIAIATEGDDQIGSIADDVLYVPKVHPIMQPIISTIPLHLFAYYIGVAKGLNVDRPRNLAKSVTVE